MSTNDPKPFGHQDSYPENPFASPTAVDESGQVEPTRTGELTLNPWISLWTKPRVTIRQIVDSDPKRSVVGLAALSGAAGAVSNNLSNVQSNVEMPVLLGMMAGSMIFGAGFGVLFWLLFSWIAKVVSGGLGGQATLVDMRAAYAWPTVISVWGAPLAVLGFIVTGGDGAPEGVVEGFGLIAVGLAQIVLAVWMIVVLAKCIGEVSLFSAWKGLGTMIIAGLLFIVPLAVVAIMLVGDMGVV